MVTRTGASMNSDLSVGMDIALDSHIAGCQLGVRPRLPTGNLHLVFSWGLAISVPWGNVPRLSVCKGSSSLRLIGSYPQKSQNAISVTFCWSVRSLMDSTDLRGQETPLLNGRTVKNVWPSLISTLSFWTPTVAHAHTLLGPMKTWHYALDIRPSFRIFLSKWFQNF